MQVHTTRVVKYSSDKKTGFEATVDKIGDTPYDQQELGDGGKYYHHDKD